MNEIRESLKGMKVVNNIELLFKRQLKYQELLISFTFIIRCQDITDEGLESLSQGLRQLAALQIITLNFNK